MEIFPNPGNKSRKSIIHLMYTNQETQTHLLFSSLNRLVCELCLENKQML